GSPGAVASDDSRAVRDPGDGAVHAGRSASDAAGTSHGHLSRGGGRRHLRADGFSRRRRQHGWLQQRVRSPGHGATPGDRAPSDAQGRAADPRRDAGGAWSGPVHSPQGPDWSGSRRGPGVGAAVRSASARATCGPDHSVVRRGHPAHRIPLALARWRLMRIRFKPTPAQRAALRAQLARLEQPGLALEILGPTPPANLHRLPVVPEPATTAQMFVAETQGRCDRLRRRWPETTALIEPLLVAIQDAATLLDPAEPAPVHGDLAAGQFLWTGDRLVLLD